MAGNDDRARPLRLNRRRLLTGGAATVATGTLLTGCDPARSATGEEGFGGAAEPFYGAHQGGIATPPQAHVVFLALDLRPSATRSPRETLAAVLKLWTSDASRLTRGQPALADTEPELAARPARLTVTVGLGPTVFEAIGMPQRRPHAADPLPAFATDHLQPQWSGGDLLAQICSDDPVVCAHTARVLLKNVRTLATQRWQQRGFRNAAGAQRSGATMRNLMGQIDGTANLSGDRAFDRHIWDDGAQQQWFAGGTVLVLRRIRAQMDAWDELDRTSKEFVLGRRLDTGAPLTGTRESDVPDLNATDNGIPVIPPNAHIALARPRTADEQFLRRPYNFDDPPPPGDTTDSGLLFAAYQRDPARQFIPVQRRLAAADAFNRWVSTVGSAVFAVLPGVQSGEFLGQSLLDTPP